MSRRLPLRLNGLLQRRHFVHNILLLLTNTSILILQILRPQSGNPRLESLNSQNRLTIHNTYDILASVRSIHGVSIALFCQGKSEHDITGISILLRNRNSRIRKTKYCPGRHGRFNMTPILLPIHPSFVILTGRPLSDCSTCYPQNPCSKPTSKFWCVGCDLRRSQPGQLNGMQNFLWK